MVKRLTNKQLSQLLVKLGFEQGKLVEKNHRIWRHSASECALLLPANKVLDAARPADIVGIRAQLDLHGHLDEEAFDFYVKEGKLPKRSSDRQ